jgi:hypothetical protein
LRRSFLITKKRIDVPNVQAARRAPMIVEISSAFVSTVVGEEGVVMVAVLVDVLEVVDVLDVLPDV